MLFLSFLQNVSLLYCLFAAPHPMLYYFFDLLYLVIGKTFVYQSISYQLNALKLLQYGRNSGCNWQCDGSVHFRTLRLAANAGQFADHELGRGRFLAHVNLTPECVFNFFTCGPWRFGEMACQIHAFSGIE